MLTQQQVADHLDLSQPQVSGLVAKLKIDLKTATLDEVRVAYIRMLRAEASGHRSEDGLDLVRERVLTERVVREHKQLEVEEKRGRLVSVEQLEGELMQMVGAFRVELLAVPDRLAPELSALYGVNVDPQIINDHITAALLQLARYDPSLPRPGETTGGDTDAAGETDHH